MTNDTRECTCHPDDNPPKPCARKYAYSECVRASKGEAAPGMAAPLSDEDLWAIWRQLPVPGPITFARAILARAAGAAPVQPANHRPSQEWYAGMIAETLDDDFTIGPAAEPSALDAAVQWLDDNRTRLHAPDCTYHQPSARCSCGLHRVLTDLRAAPREAAPAAVPTAQWDDPRVQAAYDVLATGEGPPKGSDEHWEGWAARRIVDALDALAVRTSVASHPAQQGVKE